MIEEHLSDGSKFDLSIQYSKEGKEPLETAGGIIKALPLLGDEPFLVLNADIWCAHTLSFANLSNNTLAHLVLVDNPAHNPDGDFSYQFGKIYNSGKNLLTFSGIGIYRPALFKDIRSEKISLTPVLRKAIDQNLVSAEYFSQKWFDIGTEERLAEAENYISNIRREF